MNISNQNDKMAEAVSSQASNPSAGPFEGSPTFIKMEGGPDRKQDDEKPDDDEPGSTPAEIPVTEPLTPIPMQDEVNPPLQATLGGDDVVIPLETK